MTVTTFAEIREAAGVAVEAIGDLEVHPRLGPPFNLPCAIVEIGDIGGDDLASYRQSMGAGGTMTIPLEVTVLVGRSMDDIASSQIDEYRQPTGDLSVPAALERDQTLGGVTSAVLVTGSARASRTDLDGAPVFGVVIAATAWAARERD